MQQTIIFVEDNVQFAEVLIEYIERATKYEVVHFTTPQEALNYITKNSKEIIGVISDIMMDSMDGIDFLAKLRSLKVARELPLFFLSGADPTVFADLLRPYYYCGFVEKPVDYNKLLFLINKYFVPSSYKASA